MIECSKNQFSVVYSNYTTVQCSVWSLLLLGREFLVLRRFLLCKHAMVQIAAINEMIWVLDE